MCCPSTWEAKVDYEEFEASKITNRRVLKTNLNYPKTQWLKAAQSWGDDSDSPAMLGKLLVKVKGIS